MNKKIALVSAAIFLAMPFASVMADDATTTAKANAPATNCGTMPSRPESRAKANDLQTFKTQMQTYLKCQHSNNQGQRQVLQADQQANNQQRCQNVSSRISDRIAKLGTDKTDSAGKFGDMVARLQQLSTMLSSKSLDVSKLNSDISTLQDTISKALSGQSSLVLALQTLQGEAPQMCGQSHGQFMSDLNSDRGQALAMQQARLAVRTFFASNIRPDLMAIRQSLAAASANSTTATK